VPGVSAASASNSYSASYTLVASLQTEPTSLQPDAEVNDAAYDIDQNIYNKLVTLNTHYQVVPDLAYKWAVSSNGLTYTFWLHNNVKWSDGVPFTSADVVWTLEHIVNDQGNAAATLPIKTVTPDGKYIVNVTLTHRDAAFLGFLGWYGTFILPEHIYKGTNWLTNANNEAPVGTGPFTFQSWKKGQSITLVANKNYFLGAPKVGKLVFTFIPDASTAVQALLTGETDIDLDSVPDTDLPELKANPKISTTMIAYPDFAYIDPNVQKAPMNNLLFREALAYAINRSQISQKATEGVWPVAQGMYPPVIAWAHDPNVHLPAYDPAKAEQLLNQAGLKPNAQGIRATVNLVYFNDDPFPDVALLVKDDLAKVGINVTLVELDITSWTTRVSVDHNFDLALLSGFQGPDPAALVDRVGPDGAENNGRFNNAEIDKLLLQGEELTTQSARAKVYFEIQELMLKYFPIVPITGDDEATIAGSYLHNLPWTGAAASEVTFDNFALVTVSPH
jgi:peptide/nickel transport system substrate-binding protein